MSGVRGAVHVHSDYSHDGRDSLETLRDAAIAHGLRWIALTDHAEDFDAALFREYLAHCAALSDVGLQFVPGLEYRFPDARGIHVLALGVTTWIEPGSIAPFFEQARTRATMTVLAHPISCAYKPPAVVLEHVDAIEIWNVRYNSDVLPDPRALELFHAAHARRPEMVATLGLDLHDSTKFPRSRIVAAIEPETAGFTLSTIKNGSFSSEGRWLALDAGASLDEGGMRSLRRRRAMLDLTLRSRRRLARFGRVIGID